MNKQALKHILEHALQILEESFTRDRERDYALCEIVRLAYDKYCHGVKIFESPPALPYLSEHYQPYLIMEYLQYKYSIDKSLDASWWPIAIYSWQLDRSWAEEGRRTRVRFLKTAIADL